MLTPISNIAATKNSTQRDIFDQTKNRSTSETGMRVREIIRQFEQLSVSSSISEKEEHKLSSSLDSSKTTNKTNNLKEEDKVGYGRLGKKLKEIAEVDKVHFEFVMDSESKTMLIKIIDEDTKEVIHQIPSEMTLKIAKMVDEILGRGQISDAKI